MYRTGGTRLHGSFRNVKFTRVGSIAVVDPADAYMDKWRSQFAALEISHLRSPVFAHPDAYEEEALLNFAVKTKRTDEIISPDVTSHGNHGTQNLNGKGMDPARVGLGLEGNPSASLFQDFCDSMADRLQHDFVQGTADDVIKREDGKYEVVSTHTNPADGRTVSRTLVAEAVVVATGPCGLPNIPPQFAEAATEAPGQVIHTTDLFKSGTLLKVSVGAKICQMASGVASVLVVGGGLSAAQAALAAYRAGAAVVLRSRRPLRTKRFDLDNKWLEFRMMNKLRYDFLSTPLEERLAALEEAVDGGSVPLAYINELENAASMGERFRLEVDPEIDVAAVSVKVVDNGGTTACPPLRTDDSSVTEVSSTAGVVEKVIVVNSEEYSLVILATGASLGITGSPLYVVAWVFVCLEVDAWKHWRLAPSLMFGVLVLLLRGLEVNCRRACQQQSTFCG